MSAFTLSVGPLPAGFVKPAVSSDFSISSITSTYDNCIPFGRGALNRLGSVKGLDLSVVKSNEFPEDKINIPVGVNSQNLSKFNLYQLLGFESDWADSADTEAIRKAYHKACLLYHPDKAGNQSEDRSVFLKIQESFNTLSHDSKRRAYDSQLPFDERVPSEEIVNKALEKRPEKFFKLFDPCFKRNARFAVTKPCPDIGGMNTPIDEVYRFYDYWINFDSWRDFTSKGEHKADDATCREEKRWMQKENERVTKKLKQKEMARIIGMVMLAQRKDPRITADKESQRLVKDAERQLKEEEVKRKEKEQQDLIQEVERKEAEDKERRESSKVDREKMKKLQSKARNIFRKLLRQTSTLGLGSFGEYGILSLDDAELFCTVYEYEELMEINDAFGGEAATKEPSLYKVEATTFCMEKLAALKLKIEEDKEVERLAKETQKVLELEAKASGGDKKKVGDRDWSRDHMSMLAKAVAKNPAGLPNRWELVCKFMNDQLKPKIHFTQDEVIKVAMGAAKGKIGAK